MADQPQQQIQIRIPEDVLKGRYANIVHITTTREEFIFDFGMLHPQQGGIISDRIIMNPAHAKRLIDVLGRLMQDYEKSHGKVTAAETPVPEIGFKTA